MYADRACWSGSIRSAAPTAPGCGTATAVSVRTRSGYREAKVHATTAPQSWPTT